MIDIIEDNLIKILKGFDIFERNKVSLEVKLVIAVYILSSSFRRIVLLLDVEKSTVHYWIKQFKNILEHNKGNVKKLCNSKSSY